MRNLVIVESPAKAKTIKKYLGDDFEVTSSQGHIRDLPTKEIGIDIDNNFTPKYIINPDKKRIVNDLKRMSASAKVVYLASDDDREGEAISWHLKTALELTDDKIKRIVFHEITEKAIKNAVANPRKIDMDLVNSQQARRLLDRLVGYKLSPVLWKKIKSGLSAGRVQSVAVKMIVEREREIRNFKSEKSFKVVASFKTADDKTFCAELKKNTKNEEETKALFLELSNKNFEISKVEKKKVVKSPVAPFTTSTLQQEASTKLGFSVTQTMLLAQHLYEAGKISYMRTDSVVLSEDAIKQAQKVIKQTYGEEYCQQRQFTTKSKNAQEAHEAIRPTHFEDIEVSADEKEQKLYTLIRTRALASQMADAIINKTTLTITPDNTTIFIAKGEVIEFDGFLKLYQTKKEEDEDDNIKLPKVKEGDILTLIKLIGKEKHSQGPSRFSEASLVKELEEKGIGRPSTYAPTIATIQNRGYIIKDSREGEKVEFKVITLEKNKITEEIEKKTEGSEKNKLYPTDIALITNDFLVTNFAEITNYDFTAKVEKELDDIAEGKNNWIKMLQNFYDKFISEVNKCSNSERVEFTSRLLGVDPKTGKNIYVRIAKFGPVIQIGDKNENEKPHFINLLKGQNVESITLNDVLKLMSFPKKIGEYKNKEVIVNIGPYGAYIKCGDINATIFDQSRIFDISLEEAITLIEKKIEYKQKVKKKN